MEQNSTSKPSDYDDFGEYVGMCARKRQEGWYEATVHYESILKEKDQKIAELEAQLAKLKGMSISTSDSTDDSQQNYNYNAACFPKPNGNLIIDALIELCNSKREAGKNLVNTKTDWYMVWKVLHYFKVYSGNEYDFIDVVNECVLPKITDYARRKNLSVTSNNFKAIKNSNPMKNIPVVNWRTELQKQREANYASPVQHGTFALDRGINIMVKIQKLLQERDVNSYNYEK